MLVVHLCALYRAHPVASTFAPLDAADSRFETAGAQLECVLELDELVAGDAAFVATGITDGLLAAPAPRRGVAGDRIDRDRARHRESRPPEHPIEE
jgi:hypothetical protein